MTLVNKSLDLLNFRITYKEAPIHLLEKFTFKDIDRAYESFLEHLQLKECLILQTCNRVEIFAVVDEGLDLQKIICYWATYSNLSTEEFSKIVEIVKGDRVIQHLLKLVSGLDSLVIGEDQILGQVKRSYEFARNNNYLGSFLSIIFEKSLKVGSKVRALTGINRGSVSVGSVAVNLAEESLDRLDDKKILLIGSGEGASLIAKALKRRNVSFLVTSRTFERAKSFAESLAGTPIIFEDAMDSLPSIDIIFVSTIAPYYLITYERIKKTMETKHSSLLIFDLSNPRTVEDSISQIDNVSLFNLDQIGYIVQKNIKCRREEIQSAEEIIADEMRNMDLILKRKKADPVVISVFRNVDKIRERELNKALSILGPKIGPKESKIIEQFSHALLEGILSTPMNNLRRQIQNGNNDEEQELMRIAAKLFNYENEANI
ncbi:MAG TPA: glutamyl-tRNA reductase [Nitrososphaeraceae archaeon]|nr:glutamyl-tRNA reductase [Nitrososphaeraceae archaeon]HEU5172942.1 glutamyl-tRNA reductase [Nitrososphaeraceae archaeon]